MHQGVSDSINIGRGNPSSGGEVGNSIGDNFLLGVGNLIKNDFDLSHLYQSWKHCKCLTSIKMKISMTSIYKEYEVTLKMV